MQALGVVWGKVESSDNEDVRPLSKPRHFGARLLYDYWSDCNGQGRFMVGRDVPSRALGPIMRNLMLCEPVDGGRDFRIRLAGAALLRRFGRDVTGEKYSTIFRNEVASHRCSDLREMLHSGEPVMRDVSIPQGTRPQLRFEVLSVPITASDGKSMWALTGIFYHDWAR